MAVTQVNLWRMRMSGKWNGDGENINRVGREKLSNHQPMTPSEQQSLHNKLCCIYLPKGSINQGLPRTRLKTNCPNYLTDWDEQTKDNLGITKWLNLVSFHRGHPLIVFRFIQSHRWRIRVQGRSNCGEARGMETEDN